MWTRTSPLMRRALPWLAGVAIVGNGVKLGHFWLEHERGVDLSASWWAAGTLPLVEAGILALSAAYVCSVCVLFFSNPRWQTRLTRLAPVGRMALTNYLTHSVLYLSCSPVRDWAFWARSDPRSAWHSAL